MNNPLVELTFVPKQAEIVEENPVENQDVVLETLVFTTAKIVTDAENIIESEIVTEAETSDTTKVENKLEIDVGTPKLCPKPDTSRTEFLTSVGYSEKHQIDTYHPAVVKAMIFGLLTSVDNSEKHWSEVILPFQRLLMITELISAVEDSPECNVQKGLCQYVKDTMHRDDDVESVGDFFFFEFERWLNNGLEKNDKTSDEKFAVLAVLIEETTEYNQVFYETEEDKKSIVDFLADKVEYLMINNFDAGASGTSGTSYTFSIRKSLGVYSNDCELVSIISLDFNDYEIGGELLVNPDKSKIYTIIPTFTMGDFDVFSWIGDIYEGKVPKNRHSEEYEEILNAAKPAEVEQEFAYIDGGT